MLNPGSGTVPRSGKGWTNTAAVAEKIAHDWLDNMHEEGMTDVILLDERTPDQDGRWSFTYRHAITGITATLETPGIDDWEAYERQHIFPARQYWNGGSSGNPQLADFACPGFRPLLTYAPEPPT